MCLYSYIVRLSQNKQANDFELDDVDSSVNLNISTPNQGNSVFVIRCKEIQTRMAAIE